MTLDHGELTVPTLDETLRLQEDIIALCARRDADREPFGDNALYGHARTVRAYADVHDDDPLRIAIPHGVNVQERFPFYSRRELVPTLTCWHESDVARIRAQGVRGRLVLTAAPFLYALALVQRPPNPPRGTLFFPSHSTDGTVADIDFDAIAASLERLPATQQPATACLYWRDVELGRHVSFERRGIPVVSAGHMNDPDFLFRLAHFCLLHRYAASNELGTHCFYAAAAGCLFHRWGPERGNAAEVYTENNAVRRQILDAFTRATPDRTMAFREVALDLVGARHLRSPADVRQLLQTAKRLDKFALWEPDAAGGRSVAAPCAVRRAVRTVARSALDRRRARRSRVGAGADATGGDQGASTSARD